MRFFSRAFFSALLLLAAQPSGSIARAADAPVCKTSDLADIGSRRKLQKTTEELRARGIDQMPLSLSSLSEAGRKTDSLEAAELAKLSDQAKASLPEDLSRELTSLQGIAGPPETPEEAIRHSLISKIQDWISGGEVFDGKETVHARLQASSFRATGDGEVHVPPGTPVKLTISGPAGQQKIKGVFLGHHSEQEAYYFVDSATGKILTAKMDDVKLLDKNGRVLAEDQAKGVRSIDVSIPVQSGPTCAIHSATNCLLVLEESGLMPAGNPLAHADRESLYNLFRPVGSDAYAERARRGAQAREEARQSMGFWRSLFVGAVENQGEIRARTLGDARVPFRHLWGTNSAEIYKHLEKGFPVILDTLVSPEKVKNLAAIENGAIVDRGAVLVSKVDRNSQDGHSVLAIATVPNGWFSKKIVVLDSGTGEVTLWDPKELKKAYGSDATLVYPNAAAFREEKISARKVRQESSELELSDNYPSKYWPGVEKTSFRDEANKAKATVDELSYADAKAKLNAQNYTSGARRPAEPALPKVEPEKITPKDLSEEREKLFAKYKAQGMSDFDAADGVADAFPPNPAAASPKATDDIYKKAKKLFAKYKAQGMSDFDALDGVADVYPSFRMPAKEPAPGKTFGSMGSKFVTRINPDGTVELPPYLFHWTSSRGLERMAHNNPGSPLLPMKAIRNSAISGDLPSLLGKDGLFSWSHPTGAMAASETEVYARTDDGQAPRLLMMRPKAGSSVAHLQTGTAELNAAAMANQAAWADADFIFHEEKRHNGQVFQEWIVRNPNAVEWYSADPKSFPKEVMEEIKKSATAPLSKGQVMIDDPQALASSFRAEQVESFLKGAHDPIPSEFEAHETPAAIPPKVADAPTQGRIYSVDEMLKHYQGAAEKPGFNVDAVLNYENPSVAHDIDHALALKETPDFMSASYIKGLDKTIENSPELPRDIVLRSTQSEEPLKITRDGKNITFNSYVLATAQPLSTMEDFAIRGKDPVIYEIHLPSDAGVKGVYVPVLGKDLPSSFLDQHVILAHGTQAKIVSESEMLVAGKKVTKQVLEIVPSDATEIRHSLVSGTDLKYSPDLTIPKEINAHLVGQSWKVAGEKVTIDGVPGKVFKAPDGQNAGLLHLSIIELDHGKAPPTIVKIISDDDDPSETLRSLLLAEKAGGPKVIRAGRISPNGDPEGYSYIEMSKIFPGEKTFTLKGLVVSDKANLNPLLGEKSAPRKQMAELFVRAYEAKVQPGTDFDFIFAPKKASWIDPTQWQPVTSELKRDKYFSAATNNLIQFFDQFTGAPGGPKVAAGFRKDLAEAIESSKSISTASKKQLVSSIDGTHSEVRHSLVSSPPLIDRGRTLYSESALTDLARTKPALAAAVSFEEAGTRALADARRRYLKGSGSYADLERAERLYGNLAAPVTGIDEATRRLSYLAQEEDYLATEITRAALNHDSALEAGLRAERAAVNAQRLGATQKRVHELSGQGTAARSARRGSVESLRQSFPRYADQFFGRTYDQVASDPGESRLLKLLQTKELSESQTALAEARAQLETMVREKLAPEPGAASNLAQDLVDLYAAAATPEDLAKRHPSRWTDELVKTCVQEGICEPKFTPPPPGPSPAALKIVAEERIAGADAKAAGEAAQAAKLPSGRPVQDVIETLKAEKKQIAAEASGALASVGDRLDVLDKNKSVLSQSRSLSKDEEKLNDAAATATMNFLRDADPKTLDALHLQGVGTKGVASGEERLHLYQDFKSQVQAMPPEARMKVFAAIRESAAKGEDSFAKALSKSSGEKSLTNAIERSDAVAKALGSKDGAATRAIYRDEKITPAEQSLADAIGAAKASNTSGFERRAIEANKTKELEKEIAKAAPQGREPSSLADRVGELKGLNLEQRKELSASLANVAKFEKSGKGAEAALDHMKALTDNPDMLETFRMSYVNAAKELPRQKNWDKAWEEGVKEMLLQSDYQTGEVMKVVDKDSGLRFYQQTARCLKI